MPTHKPQEPVFERRDERGLFQEVLNEGQWEALIVAQMNEGAVLGNHYHKETVLFLFLTSGSARIRTVHVESGSQDDFILQANQGAMLRPGEAHAIRFLEAGEIVILKSRAYRPEAPDIFSYPIPED